METVVLSLPFLVSIGFFFIVSRLHVVGSSLENIASELESDVERWGKEWKNFLILKTSASMMIFLRLHILPSLQDTIRASDVLGAARSAANWWGRFLEVGMSRPGIPGTRRQLVQVWQTPKRRRLLQDLSGEAASRVFTKWAEGFHLNDI